MGFSDDLARAVQQKRSPLVVGIDPRWDQLPEALREGGDGLAERAAAFREFSLGVIGAVEPHAAAIKPQVAFFEELGPHGMTALGDVIAAARAAGLPVIVDGKRNDIGSTAEAYARGWLGRGSAWGGDALTVSPYLGDDSLDPFVEVATDRGAGLFVLVKTSNPGGALWQDRVADGQTLYQSIGAHVQSLAVASLDECGYGAVGAVVGATYPRQLAELRELMPHVWFLIPGYGSQGGTAADVAAGFAADGLGAVVNSSRGVIFAYQRSEYVDRAASGHWTDCVAAAAADAVADLRRHTPAGRL
ncbi:Orotidine 5'-phosphate decarboxylase [Pirellulimonas nuda]|uniref:Orotidine 5'-phosphate decarboxylase n=1 Tax=Pirellulimonas nuda TaxID=2528009 RepID=A0A518D9X3_9BACT|nr:orotidine-5'-phosphate decarboxylase [Pirellulimonas nuda]QDU88243.1 Orotidine 5'-phosphate decarboxylase [Pirellulimonas nuda]